VAIIPMRQTITVTRGGDIDEWGNATPGETLTFDCRIDEGSQVRQYRSAGTTESEIIVATARILLDKLADIRETDTIAYTNELGITIEKKPKEINVKRNVGGKPVLTEVVI
jgi:hypothetical protein